MVPVRWAAHQGHAMDPMTCDSNVITIMATQLRSEYYTMRLDGRTRREHVLHRSYVRVYAVFTVLYPSYNLAADATMQFYTQVQESVTSFTTYVVDLQ
jgi:hypothetical protein